jgi:hypothetical protein
MNDPFGSPAYGAFVNWNQKSYTTSPSLCSRMNTPEAECGTKSGYHSISADQ